MTQPLDSDAAAPAVDAAPAPPAAAPGPLAVLGIRDFRWYWLGNFTSLVGSQIHIVVEGWLVLALTDSAFMLGVTSAAIAIPMLPLALFGGVVADRTDRRRLLMGAQAILMTASLLLAVLVWTDAVQVWHVIALALLAGTVMAFYQPAAQVFVFDLVGPDRLMNAISLNTGAAQAARMIGPVLAGLLVAQVGIAAGYGVDALTFGVVIAALLAVRARQAPVEGREPAWRSLREGLAYIRRDETMMWLVILIFTANVVGTYAIPLMPLFARDILGVGATGLGWLLAAQGVGAVLATAVLASLRNVRRRALVLFGAAIIFDIGTVIFAFSHVYALSLAVLFVQGFMGLVFVTMMATILQLRSRPDMRGRVMSLMTLSINTIPLSALLGGSLAALIGPGPAVALGAAAAIVLDAGALIFVPGLRRL